MQPLTKAGELKVSYKLRSNLDQLPIINSSKDAYDLLINHYPKNSIALQEHFIVAYLNRSNRVIGVYHSTTGGVTGTVVDPRLILGVALKMAACGLILSHNHPSGNLTPSIMDKEMTTKVSQAGKFMDINLLDHLIVSPVIDHYCSFADEGLL